MPTCDNCGTDYSKGQTYCGECGEEVGTDERGAEYRKAAGNQEPKIGDLDLNTALELVDGEVIVEGRRPTYLNWFKLLIIAGVSLLFGLFMGFNDLIFGGGIVERLSGAFFWVFVGVIFAGGLAGYVWYQRQKVLYIFTNRRFVEIEFDSPVIQTIAGVSEVDRLEIWIDDITTMKTGSNLVERIVSVITGGTLGHIEISLVSNSLLNIGGGSKPVVYNHEDCARVIRNARNETFYRHKDLTSSPSRVETVSNASEGDD